MKTLSLLLIAMFVFATPALAQEAATKSRTKVGAAFTMWQEPLKLQSVTGASDQSVATFRGMSIAAERMIAPRSWGGYALAGTLGAMAAAGGGTSSAVDYRKGSLASTLVLVQPKMVYAFSDRASAAIGVAAIYRTIQWPSTSTVQVAQGRDYGALLTFDIALGITQNLEFRQTYGFGSLEVGGYWQWGLSYAL